MRMYESFNKNTGVSVVLIHYLAMVSLRFILIILVLRENHVELVTIASTVLSFTQVTIGYSGQSEMPTNKNRNIDTSNEPDLSVRFCQDLTIFIFLEQVLYTNIDYI